MANFLQILTKLVYLIDVFTQAILLWKTLEYFNTLPETNKYKPVIAWNIITAFFVTLFFVCKLIVK